MNRIHEEYKHETLLLPQSQGNGGNTTGAYKSIANAVGDILIIVTCGPLAAGKKLTAEVLQADDAVPNNAEEVTACETVLTAAAGGILSGKVMISMNPAQLTKPFVTVKVTNDADQAVLIGASMLFEPAYGGAGLNAPDKLTVI
jgi:hypothetical protein